MGDAHDEFERDGFVEVGELVAPEELPGLIEVVQELVGRVATAPDADFQDLTGGARDDDGVPGVPQVLAPHRHAPVLLEQPFVARAADVGRDLLGPEAVTSIAMIVAKPPHSAATVPWHQDAAYWGHEVDTCGASIWIALQDVDERNGCMCFVPGSHRQGVLAHRHLDDDPAIHALELDPERRDAWVAGATAVPLAAGHACAHAGHTLHSTGPNETDRPRLALVLSVRNPTRDEPTPWREPFPWDSPPDSSSAPGEPT